MDRRDRWHDTVRVWWAGPDSASVLVPEPTLPEVCHLLARRAGAHAEARFIRSVANGEFTLARLQKGDLGRAADLMVAYADLPLGFVDAAIVAVAERLRARTLLTTDRKHFGVIRPRHAEAFELVP